MHNTSPTSGFAPVEGGQLYYETEGRGHALLLIHAGVADSRMWQSQFDDFAQFYRVIRYDLRGFGRSPLPAGLFASYDDVRDLLNYLGVEQAVVVGISFGGRVAVDFAMAHPEYVTALILGAPSVGGAPPSARVQQFWEDEEAALERGDLDAATELNLRLWVDGPQRAPDEVSPAVRQLVHQMQLDAFAAEAEAPADAGERPLSPPATGRLAEIQAPTLVVVGNLDLEEKQTEAARVASAIPGAELTVMPGVAHMMNMEKPALFNEIVLSFLARQLG